MALVPTMRFKSFAEFERDLDKAIVPRPKNAVDEITTMLAQAEVNPQPTGLVVDLQSSSQMKATPFPAPPKSNRSLLIVAALIGLIVIALFLAALAVVWFKGPVSQWPANNAGGGQQEAAKQHGKQ
jgi:hypothetical protein